MMLASVISSRSVRILAEAGAALRYVGRLQTIEQSPSAFSWPPKVATVCENSSPIPRINYYQRHPRRGHEGWQSDVGWICRFRMAGPARGSGSRWEARSDFAAAVPS